MQAVISRSGGTTRKDEGRRTKDEGTKTSFDFDKEHLVRAGVKPGMRTRAAFLFTLGPWHYLYLAFVLFLMAGALSLLLSLL